MTPRPYQLGKRALTSAENRAKVLVAARTLFGRLGYRDVSMDEVAREAGVGRTTVFEQFRSKTALFEAVSEEMRRQIFAAKFGDVGAGTLDARLNAALHGGQALWGSELDLFRRFHGMAALEPGACEATGNDLQERRAQTGVLARDLIAAGRARPGVSEADLADVLSLLTSFAAFSQLRRARGDGESVTRVLDLLLSSVLVAAH